MSHLPSGLAAVATDWIIDSKTSVTNIADCLETISRRAISSSNVGDRPGEDRDISAMNCIQCIALKNSSFFLLTHFERLSYIPFFYVKLTELQDNEFARDVLNIRENVTRLFSVGCDRGADRAKPGQQVIGDRIGE